MRTGWTKAAREEITKPRKDESPKRRRNEDLPRRHQDTKALKKNNVANFRVCHSDAERRISPDFGPDSFRCAQDDMGRICQLVISRALSEERRSNPFQSVSCLAIPFFVPLCLCGSLAGFPFRAFLPSGFRDLVIS